VFREAKLLQGIHSMKKRRKELEDEQKSMPQRFAEDVRDVKINIEATGAAALEGVVGLTVGQPPLPGERL